MQLSPRMASLLVAVSAIAVAHQSAGSKEHAGQQRWRPRKRFWHTRRRQNMAVLAGLMTVAISMLGLGGWGDPQSPQAILINVGADLIGAIVTIFVITPIVSRAAEGRVREHPRLDYGWYVERVAGATSIVRIMDTYSNLLDGPHTADFFRAVEQALTRQAKVQILLLNPDSLAATQHTHEPDNPDAHREIMRNFRVLDDFHNEDRPMLLSRNFSVRIYTAPPSITVYRWDEKTLVSFLSADKISSQGVQLEVTVGSPLGEFVNERFSSLWTVSKDLGEFMRLPVTLTDTDVADQHFNAEFVQLNNKLYLNDWRIVVQMTRRKAGTSLIYSRYHQHELNELTIVDDTQPELYDKLSDRFQEKYGHSNEVFISIEPAKENLHIPVPRQSF